MKNTFLKSLFRDFRVIVPIVSPQVICCYVASNCKPELHVAQNAIGRQKVTKNDLTRKSNLNCLLAIQNTSSNYQKSIMRLLMCAIGGQESGFNEADPIKPR